MGEGRPDARAPLGAQFGGVPRSAGSEPVCQADRLCGLRSADSQGQCPQPVRRSRHRSGASAIADSQGCHGRRRPEDRPASKTTMSTVAESVATHTITRQRAARLRDDGFAGWLFALPHLILFGVFLLAPTLYGFYISLHHWPVL